MNSHGTIRIGAVAAHPACGVGHIREPPVTVIPEEGERQKAPEGEKKKRVRGQGIAVGKLEKALLEYWNNSPLLLSIASEVDLYKTIQHY